MFGAVCDLAYIQRRPTLKIVAFPSLKKIPRPIPISDAYRAETSSCILRPGCVKTELLDDVSYDKHIYFFANQWIICTYMIILLLSFRWCVILLFSGTVSIQLSSNFSKYFSGRITKFIAYLVVVNDRGGNVWSTLGVYRILYTSLRCVWCITQNTVMPKR